MKSNTCSSAQRANKSIYGAGIELTLKFNDDAAATVFNWNGKYLRIYIEARTCVGLMLFLFINNFLIDILSVRGIKLLKLAAVASQVPGVKLVKFSRKIHFMIFRELCSWKFWKFCSGKSWKTFDNLGKYCFRNENLGSHRALNFLKVSGKLRGEFRPNLFLMRFLLFVNCEF